MSAAPVFEAPPGDPIDPARILAEQIAAVLEGERASLLDGMLALHALSSRSAVLAGLSEADYVEWVRTGYQTAVSMYADDEPYPAASLLVVVPR